MVNKIKLIVGESPYPGRKTYKKLEIKDYLKIKNNKKLVVGFISVSKIDDKNLVWCSTMKKVLNFLYEDSEINHIKSVKELLKLFEDDGIFLVNIYNNLLPNNKIDKKSSIISIIEKFIKDNSDKKIEILMVGKESVKIISENFGNKKYKNIECYSIIHPAARGRHSDQVKKQWITRDYKVMGNVYSESDKLKEVFTVSRTLTKEI